MDEEVIKKNKNNYSNNKMEHFEVGEQCAEVALDIPLETWKV